MQNIVVGTETQVVEVFLGTVSVGAVVAVTVVVVVATVVLVATVVVGAAVVAGAGVAAGEVGAGVPLEALVVAGEDLTVGGTVVSSTTLVLGASTVAGGRVVLTRRVVEEVAMVGPGPLPGFDDGNPAMARPIAAPQNSTMAIR